MDGDKSLLERAQESEQRVYQSLDISPDEMAFTLAWANDEISNAQAQQAMRAKTGHPQTTVPYSLFARALKKHLQELKKTGQAA